MDPVNEFLGSVHVISAAVDDWLREELRRRVGDKVTLSQIKLLKLVAATDALSITDVATLLGVSNAAASKAVDRLVKRGFLDRTVDEIDRRTTRLSVTAAGRKTLKSYDDEVRNALATAFEHYPESELKRAAALLDRIAVDLVERSNKADTVCMRCSIHFREKCLLRKHVGRSCLYHR